MQLKVLKYKRTMIVIAVTGILIGIPLYVWRFDKWFIKVRMQSSIGIYQADDPFRWTPAGGITNPVLVASDVSDIQAEIIADPFMVREDNAWYMFFEALNAETKKGEIALASSQDGLHWTYRRVVIAESFHMSYPYVFKWDNVYYMIPETHLANGIRLYKADAFPEKWSFAGTLFDGMFQDPSLVRYEEKWWLFASDVIGNDRLRVFYSDQLMGPWAEHAKSPVIVGDATKARPAGRMMVHHGRVVRYAQDDGRFYGRAVRAFIINRLTTTDYDEHEAPISPILEGSQELLTWWTWNAKGMHHIDPHQIEQNKWIACVDGFYKYHYWSWEVLRPLFTS